MGGGKFEEGPTSSSSQYLQTVSDDTHEEKRMGTRVRPR